MSSLDELRKMGMVPVEVETLVKKYDGSYLGSGPLVAWQEVKPALQSLAALALSLMVCGNCRHGRGDLCSVFVVHDGGTGLSPEYLVVDRSDPCHFTPSRWKKR